MRPLEPNLGLLLSYTRLCHSAVEYFTAYATDTTTTEDDYLATTLTFKVVVAQMVDHQTLVLEVASSNPIFFFSFPKKQPKNLALPLGIGRGNICPVVLLGGLKIPSLLGSGYGSVGRAVASDTREPCF